MNFLFKCLKAVSGSKDLLENDGVHVLSNHWIVCFHPNLTGTGWGETTDFKVENALGWAASGRIFEINYGKLNFKIENLQIEPKWNFKAKI
jgi:hypothetical protein